MPSPSPPSVKRTPYTVKAYTVPQPNMGAKSKRSLAGCEVDAVVSLTSVDDFMTLTCKKSQNPWLLLACGAKICELQGFECAHINGRISESTMSLRDKLLGDLALLTGTRPRGQS